MVRSTPLVLLLLVLVAITSVAAYVHPMVNEYRAYAAHPDTDPAEAASLLDKADDLMYRTRGVSQGADQESVWLATAGFNSSEPNQTAPIAYLFGGGTCAGKSRLRDVFIQQTNLDPKKVIWLDPDQLMTVIECYQDNLPSPLCRAGTGHFEGSLVSISLFEKALSARYHIVVDSTLGSTSKALNFVDALNKQGYNITIIGTTRPTVKSAIKAVDRARDTSRPDGYERWVPLSAVVGTHSGYSRSFLTYLGLYGQGKISGIYQFKSGSNHTMSTLASNGMVYDSKNYNDFLQKMYDTEGGVMQQLVASARTDITAAYASVDQCPKAPSGLCCRALTVRDPFLQSGLKSCTSFERNSTTI
eukprot:PhM_4_TR7682/c0_g1_i1/m.74215